jgi:hypothetical protein
MWTLDNFYARPGPSDGPRDAGKACHGWRTSGERLATTELAGASWKATWKCLGLPEARETLQAWLGQREVEAEAEAELVEEEEVAEVGMGYSLADF